MTLQQIRWGLHAAGKDVAAIAPSQTAVDELEKVGLHGAMTIAHLLLDHSAQRRLAGKVVFLDEASMVSASDMVQILRLVEKQGCRLLFSGDTRQIRAVEAGDGLQTLERHSALQTASLKTVRRQIPITFSNYDVKIVGGRLFPVHQRSEHAAARPDQVAMRSEMFSKRETITTRIDVTEVDQEGG